LYYKIYHIYKTFIIQHIMSFQHYSSIDGPQTGFGQKLISLYGNKEVIILEKIHGANFSICGCIENTTIKFAKRSGIIHDTDDFMHYWLIKDKLEVYAQNLKAYLINKNMMTKNFQLFGEIFGGCLPGYGSKTKMVQKEIYYSPELEFMPFDLKIDDVYMTYTTIVPILKDAGFKPVEILGKMTLLDALKIDVNTFKTTIPKFLGYDNDHPSLHENYAEGIVVKTDDLQYYGPHRFVLKIKSNKFREKSAPIRLSKSSVPNISDEAKETLEELLTYLCENRLNAVISKIGTVNRTMLPKVSGLLVKDILEEFYKEGNEFPKYGDPNKEKLEKKLLNQELSNRTYVFVEQHIHDT